MLGSLRNKPTAVTIFLIISTIVLFNLGLGYFFLLVHQSQEKDLNNRLNAIAHLLPQALNTMSILLLSAGDEDSTIYTNAIAMLKEHKEFNSLRSIMLLRYDGERLTVAIDADEDFAIGDEMALLLVDNEEIGEALDGEVTTTPLYFVDEVPYKRTYAPIADDEGVIVALLRIEANIGYYAELALLKQRLIALSVITSCILIIVAGIFHKIVLRLVNAERAVAQADRLRAMGRLSAGIAHEIRNPLGIIRASAEHLSGELADCSDDTQGVINDIIEEVDRINTLLTQFLHLAHPRVGASDHVSPVEVARSIVSLMATSLKKERKSIFLDVKGEIPDASISHDNYRQVLLNLILNAKDATGENGAIRVVIERNDNRVKTVVTDDGCGIAKKDMKSIFEPFFTTKGGGSGLGLSISKSIVESCKGAIFIDDSKGKGTSVVVELPVKKRVLS